MKTFKDKTGEWYGGTTLLNQEQQKFNVNAFANYFKNISSFGWSNNAIIAMLCNISAESHINPQQSQIGGGGGYGLTQWTPKNKLLNRAKGLGLSGSYNTMYTQCCVIDKERTNNGIYKQWSNRDPNYYMAFDDFARSQNNNIRYLVGVFLNCYEGAKNITEQKITDRYNGENGGIGHSIIENVVNGGSYSSVDGFIDWLLNIANDNDYIYQLGANHGVNWNNYLTLKKFDCSSFISFGLYQGGGYDLTTQFTTSNQKSELVELGFNAISFKNKSQLIKGDILLTDGHTEAVSFSDGTNVRLVGAHTHYPNDSANDISERNYYDDNWHTIIRPFDSGGDREYTSKRTKNKGLIYLPNKRLYI